MKALDYSLARRCAAFRRWSAMRRAAYQAAREGWREAVGIASSRVPDHPAPMPVAADPIIVVAR